MYPQSGVGKEQEESAKLTKPLLRPDFIKQILSENTYELADPKSGRIMGRYYINSLYDYHTDILRTHNINL